MARQSWYESDNPTTVARGATWRVGAWFLAIFLSISLLSVGVWGFKVATSDVKGKGDAVQKVNDGGNRLAQQAYFEQTWADIKKADTQLDQLAADKAANTDGADVRYSGAVTYCLGLIADYDAAARKEIAAKFKAVDLPEQIDTTSPATDCAPTGGTK